MPNTTTTPNMNLVLPVPGQDPGPDWAQNQYASGFIIDGHNHTSGQGVPIPTAGININTDLTFSGQNAFNLNSVRFNNLGSSLPATAPNLGCIYEANGEFYYNDAAGNQVQITKSGTVNATSSGIVSGTASAGFVGGVLVVDQNTNTPGNIQAGSYFFGNNTPASNFAEVSAPSALAASYSMVLPPTNSTGQTSFLAYDTSNNIVIGPPVSTLAQNTPSGGVIMYVGSAAPTSWLLCDGTAYSRATYAALFAAIGTAYGVGDGSTTFNVPDFRGIFPRGVDNGAGNDPDTSSRTAVNGGNSGDLVGSLQTQATAVNGLHDVGHSHGIPYSNGIGGTGFPQPNLIPNNVNGSTFGSFAALAGDNETRPINLYVNFIIKT